MEKISMLRIAALASSLMLVAVAACKPEIEPRSYVRATSGVGDQFMLSLKPNDPDNEQYDLIVAAPIESDALGLCPVTENQPQCEPGGNNFFGSKPIFATATKKFYLISSPIKLEDGYVVRLLGLAEGGRQIGSRDIMFSWSGGGSGPGDRPSGQGASGSQASGQSGSQAAQGSASVGAGAASSSNAQVQAIVQRSCDEGCHHTFASDLGSMKYSGSLERIQSGNMPKNRSISAQDRQTLVSFLQK